MSDSYKTFNVTGKSTKEMEEWLDKHMSQAQKDEQKRRDEQWKKQIAKVDKLCDEEEKKKKTNEKFSEPEGKKKKGT